jgi:hypothetical protein
MPERYLIHKSQCDGGARYTRGVGTTQTRSSSPSRRRSTLTMNSRCDTYAASVDSSRRWGGPILGPSVRYLINLIGMALFNIVFRVRNRFSTVGRSPFLNLVFNRTKGRGLLSISNHLSVIDKGAMGSTASAAENETRPGPMGSVRRGRVLRRGRTTAASIRSRQCGAAGQNGVTRTAYPEVLPGSGAETWHKQANDFNLNLLI